MTMPSLESGYGACRPVAATVKPKTISVDGVIISRAAIAREAQNHPASKPIEAWQAAARALVIRELLLAEARRIGLQPAPRRDGDGRREAEDEALVRQLLAREVTTPDPDEATCLRYHEQNRRRFLSPTLHEVSHILVPVRENEDEALREAWSIIGLLKGNVTTFAEMARAHSACPSREMGGNLGQIGPGQTVPEFEAALAGLPVEDVASEPVRSRYGFHVVRVERRIEGRLLPFDLVHERIATFLADRVRRVAERQYVQILAGKASIEGFSLGASSSPLVQ